MLDELGEIKVGYESSHPYDCGDVSVAAAGCLDIDLMYSEVGWGSGKRMFVAGRFWESACIDRVCCHACVAARLPHSLISKKRTHRTTTHLSRSWRPASGAQLHVLVQVGRMVMVVE